MLEYNFLLAEYLYTPQSNFLCWEESLQGEVGGCCDSGLRWQQSRGTVRAAVTGRCVTGGIHTALASTVFFPFEANTVLSTSQKKPHRCYSQEKRGKKIHGFPLESIKIICSVTSVPWACSIAPSFMSMSRVVPLVLPAQGDHSICHPLPRRCCRRSAGTAAGTVGERGFDKKTALAHTVYHQISLCSTAENNLQWWFDRTPPCGSNYNCESHNMKSTPRSLCLAKQVNKQLHPSKSELSNLLTALQHQ